MKRFLGAASAALILASSSALAQAPAQPPAPAMTPNAMSPSAQGDAMGNLDVDIIVAALNDPEGEIGKLSSLPTDATVEVVDLDVYMQGDVPATLTSALNAADDHGDAVRAALEGNSAIQAQLTAQNVDFSNVVGFGIDGSTLMVFVHDAADATNQSSNPQGDAAAGGPPAPAQ